MVPLVSGLSPVVSSFPQELISWDPLQFKDLFQEVGGYEPSHESFVIRIDSFDQRENLDDFLKSHGQKCNGSIVQESDCYVNGQDQHYCVVQSSSALASSAAFQVLIAKCKTSFILPVALKEGKPHYFAPDMLHVDWKNPQKEIDLHSCANSLGMVYYPPKFAISGQTHTVFYLKEEVTLMEAHAKIGHFAEISTVSLHQLPEAAVV